MDLCVCNRTKILIVGVWKSSLNLISFTASDIYSTTTEPLDRKWKSPLLHKMIKTKLTTNCILNKLQINIRQVQQSFDLYPAAFSGLIWLQGQKELLYKLSVGKPTMQMQSQMSNSTLNDNSYHSDRISIFPPPANKTKIVLLWLGSVNISYSLNHGIRFPFWLKSMTINPINEHHHQCNIKIAAVCEQSCQVAALT